MENHAAPASRAELAKQRVAARFASAPSYNEMLAREARAAAHAAEAASKAAQEAHAAARSVLATLEGASAPDSEWGAQGASEDIDQIEATGEMEQIQPEPNGPVLVQNAPGIIEVEPDAPPQAFSPSQIAANGGGAAGADSEPIYANLINFPREVVATRKLRPRRAEGPLGDALAGAQLSIFEVDPSSISTEPALAASNESAAPDWMRQKWAAIETENRLRPSALDEPEPPAAVSAALNPAPLSLRLMASLVDVSLVFAVFAVVVRLASSHLKAPLSIRAFEVIAFVAVLMIGAIYETLFFNFAKTTPGMKYAGISLSTLEGDSPDRAQRSRRLVAMLLSVLPLGLGLVWALLDNDMLTWHDRLSGTYLRKI
jgi:uncharacterized RDD family membrane protein YckC